MEDKDVEIITIDDIEYIIMDEDKDVIYATELDYPANVAILKKDGDDLIKLDKIDSMPYYDKFISKYGTTEGIYGSES